MASETALSTRYTASNCAGETEQLRRSRQLMLGPDT